MGRALEPIADLGWIDLQLGDDAAERVAMHAQFLRGLTLIALVVRQYDEQVTAFKFPHSLFIGNTTRMHCCYKGFQFAFHKNLSLMPGMFPASFESVA